MIHMDYETRLERCKREDTKENMIVCLDQASIDNSKQLKSEFIGALEFVGSLLIVIAVLIFILHRIFVK